MPFVSENTQYGVFFELHETAEDAVDHLLREVGSDYSDDFWASDDGESIIENSRSSLDFSLRIYPSVADAVKSQVDLDLETLPAVLRSIADAVDRFYAVEA